MDDYRLIADELGAQIATGRLRPGEQLPTQRAFARRRGIAASTAGRVYAELVRRGLVVGEVGRGTFVRATEAAGGAVPLAEPSRLRVDLELNYPVVPEQSALLAAGLTPLLRPDALDAALRQTRAEGTPAAREAFASLLAGDISPIATDGSLIGDLAVPGSPAGPASGRRSEAGIRPGAPLGELVAVREGRRAADGWQPDPDALLFAAGGRQAVAAVLAALVRPGERLGVEALTYPVVRAIARRLGITLVPLTVDEHGVVPESLAAAHRSAPLRAVYLQPRVHNPLGITVPAARREALVAELERLGLTAVEDGIWGFLDRDALPLAAPAPERVILVDSLSKRLAPGLSTGFALVPAPLRETVAASLRSGAWLPSGFALEAAVRWIGDGTVARIAEAKRADATARQQLATRCLPGQRLRAHPGSYFCWWELPSRWRADPFVAAANRAGIGITPASAYTVTPGSAPHAVRIGLASPPLPVLEQSLRTLAAIAERGPDAGE